MALGNHQIYGFFRKFWQQRQYAGKFRTVVRKQKFFQITFDKIRVGIHGQLAEPAVRSTAVSGDSLISAAEKSRDTSLMA